MLMSVLLPEFGKPGAPLRYQSTETAITARITMRASTHPTAFAPLSWLPGVFMIVSAIFSFLMNNECRGAALYENTPPA